MAKPTIVSLNTDAYVQVAADVSALTLLQIHPLGAESPSGESYGAEFIVDSSLPADDDVGVFVRSGESLIAAAIAGMGAVGVLYGKASSAGIDVITVP